MPLYEYQCDSCGARFERIQKFSDPHVDACPSCGQAVRRLVSSPAFQFKGSGWYVTDYARSGKAAGGEAGESKPADKDAKPAAGESTSAAPDKPKAPPAPAKAE